MDGETNGSQEATQGAYDALKQRSKGGERPQQCIGISTNQKSNEALNYKIGTNCTKYYKTMIV